jgi:hypothetical protein
MMEATTGCLFCILRVGEFNKSPRRTKMVVVSGINNTTGSTAETIDLFLLSFLIFCFFLVLYYFLSSQPFRPKRTCTNTKQQRPSHVSTDGL